MIFYVVVERECPAYGSVLSVSVDDAKRIYLRLNCRDVLHSDFDYGAAWRDAVAERGAAVLVVRRERIL